MGVSNPFSRVSVIKLIYIYKVIPVMVIVIAVE